MRKEISLDNMANFMSKCINPVIYCHPENGEELAKQFRVENGDVYTHPFSLFGIKIVYDKNLPRFTRKWEFPEDRFVEYENSDEAWAIPVGYGRWVDTEDLAFYVIDQTIFGRTFTPSIWSNKSYLYASI